MRDIDEKCVMALRAVQRHEIDFGAGRAQAVGDLLLLRQRKQDIGADADDQCAFDVDALECRGDIAVAVFGNIEPIAGSRRASRDGELSVSY